MLSGMEEWWKAVLESDWEKNKKFVLRMLKAEEVVIRRLIGSARKAVKELGKKMARVHNSVVERVAQIKR